MEVVYIFKKKKLGKVSIEKKRKNSDYYTFHPVLNMFNYFIYKKFNLSTTVIL